MTVATQEKAYSLVKEDTVVLHDAFGATVCCRAGCIWLTQYGDSRDIVLKSGDCFQIDRGTVIVIEAMQAAQVAILATPPAKLLAEGWRAFPGRLLRRMFAPRWRAAANARMWTLH